MIERSEIGVILDEDVDKSINNKNEVESIKKIRRCFARALHFQEKIYLAWLNDCTIQPDEEGYVITFDSWFKADYVSQSYGKTLSRALKSKGGLYAIKFEGPPSDEQRASLFRDWVSCDEEDHIPGGAPEIIQSFDELTDAMKEFKGVMR